MKKHNLKSDLLFWIIICFGIFGVAGRSEATDYYVSLTGSDSALGDVANPFFTISKGLSVMSGGDTLIVKNGTYTDRDDMLVADHYAATIPSGTPSAFTTIRAETPYGVRLKWTSSLGAYYDAPVYIERSEYVHIDGFIYEVLNLENPSYVVNLHSNNNKITRTIVKRSEIDDYGGWYSVTGNDNLLEDTAGVGAARYGYNSGGPNASTQRNVFRRCVGRMDFANTTQPKATFAVYGNNATSDVRDASFQNCIALDGGRPSANGGEEKYGAFYNPKNATNVYYKGVLVLNEAVGHAGMFAQEWGSGIDLENSVIYDLSNSSAWAVGLRANDGAKISASHLTIGGTLPGGYLDEATVTDSLLGGSPANLLNNSPGATILYRYGTSGSRWGDADWNTLTGESLWPWPYEAEIKTVFAEQLETPLNYTPTNNDSDRGFAANSNGLYGGPITLTSYIWEYLGNTCPVEICGGSVDITPPSAPSGLSVN